MPDDDASSTPAPEPETATEQPSPDQQQTESAQAEPSTEQQPAESSADQPEDDRQAAAEGEQPIADEQAAQPAEAEADADAQPDEGDKASETEAEFEGDDDIVFNETAEPRAEAEPEPPSAEAEKVEPPEEETPAVEASDAEEPEVEAADAEPTADDTPEPEVVAADTEQAAEDTSEPEAEAETETETHKAAPDDEEETSDSADAEWSVDKDPDTATTEIAPAEIVAPGSTEVAAQPTAVAVTPAGPVVESTAEEVFVASEHGPKRSKGVGLALAWAALILLVGGASAAAYIYRFDIVRTVPAAAGAYRAVGIPVNTRGLEIRDLAYSWEVESTRAVLVVQGQVVNITSEPLEVPQLVLALRDQELANLREVPANVGLRSPLQPGAEAQFRVRILAPPETTSNVFVRFAEAR